MTILIPPSDEFLVPRFILLLSAIAAGEIASRLGLVPLAGLITTLIAPVAALWAWRSTPASRAELEEPMPSIRHGRPLRLGPTIDGPPAPPAPPVDRPSAWRHRPNTPSRPDPPSPLPA